MSEDLSQQLYKELNEKDPFVPKGPAKTEQEALELQAEDPDQYFQDKEIYDSTENDIVVNGPFPNE